MNGDPINDPQANIGRRFASPIKKGSDRTTRAIERQRTKRNLEVQSLLTASSSASESSTSSSRVLCSSNNSDDHLPAVTESPAEAMERDEEPMTALVGEQLLGDYQVIDLPDNGSTAQASCTHLALKACLQSCILMVVLYNYIIKMCAILIAVGMHISMVTV